MPWPFSSFAFDMPVCQGISVQYSQASHHWKIQGTAASLVIKCWELSLKRLAGWPDHVRSHAALNNFFLRFAGFHTKAGVQWCVRLEISKAGQHHQLLSLLETFFESPAAPSSTRQITDNGHPQQVQSRCECPNATFRPISRTPGRRRRGVHRLFVLVEGAVCDGAVGSTRTSLSMTPSQTALDQQRHQHHVESISDFSIRSPARQSGRLTCQFSAAQGQLGHPEAPRGRCPRLR